MQRDKLKVAFLDRDGVINKEVNYLYKVEDFEYTLGCINGLKGLQNLGFKLIVITNQAGIARGYYTEAEYQKLTAWFTNDLKDLGVDILDVFYCPHHPSGVVEEYSIECICRKPRSGLFERAIQKYGIDIENSLMIGDKPSDLEAAKNIGIAELIMVETGHIIPDHVRDVYKVFANLYEAYTYCSNNKDLRYIKNE